VTVGERLRRLPLRVRLVAGFSATMLVVLTGAGAFVYWRVSFALDRQLNGELSEVSRLLAPQVTPSGMMRSGGQRVVADELFQVLDRDGRVLSASPALGDDPVLPADAARAALDAPVRRDIGALLPVTRHPLRVYAVALPDAGAQPAAVLVVAARRDHRDEALLELLGQLAVAGIGALLITALVGDRLAKAALRPVEAYRLQAAEIVAGASGVRLDVPAQRQDEVTRLGDTLNAMLDALEGALDRERHFVNDASHELRTPLTLLRTRVQLARRRPRSVAEHEAVLAEIETDVVRLTALAEQLLEVGVPSQDGASGCDLADVVRHEVARRGATARDGFGRERVSVTAAGSVPVAIGEVQSARLVNNLLDNAHRHGAPPVHVVVDRVQGYARLVVTDGGPGMSPDMLATATRRFARAAESRPREGFGLGLSLVESIVLRAGGELRLCSGGHHESFGGSTVGQCDHGDAMTVTVILPAERPVTGGSSAGT
jgi:two-component system OmpR family sensor kinase